MTIYTVFIFIMVYHLLYGKKFNMTKENVQIIIKHYTLQNIPCFIILQNYKEDKYIQSLS